MSRGKIEKAHIQRVKELPCGLCGAPPPSDAHHMLQGRTPQKKSPDMLVIPLCHQCHMDLHNGRKELWRVYKIDEHNVLAETIKKIFY